MSFFTPESACDRLLSVPSPGEASIGHKGLPADLIGDIALDRWLSHAYNYNASIANLFNPV